ncbi:hypothetical protein [Streptomyces sp. CA-146814]|uniref:hypothetical protein n=1 Tax=Streptomyces sp. CA-146814 TaxID=3240053 RepID=UPI003D94439D
MPLEDATPSPSPGPPPTPPSSSQREEISDIQKAITEAKEAQKRISATYQDIYWSIQTWKVDPSIGTFAPEVMTFDPTALEVDPNLIRVNERGLSIAGVEVLKNPLTTWLEGTALASDTRTRHREGEPPTSGWRQGIDDKLAEAFATLRAHGRRIETLARGQQTLARHAGSGVAERRSAAESRRQATRFRGRPTPAAQEAQRLRQLESALAGVEAQAKQLARAL